MATRQSSGTTSRPNGLAVGAITAAAVVLILAGVLNAMQGVVGLATNEFYVATRRWLFQFDVTTWGWVHILIGLIAAATGVALLYGAFWARILGVVVAAVSVIANSLWLPYYPLWAIVIIAFDVLVIWALTAHGRDTKKCVTPAESPTTESDRRAPSRGRSGGTFCSTASAGRSRTASPPVPMFVPTEMTARLGASVPGTIGTAP